MSYADFCLKVRVVCLLYGLSVTSWGRSRKRNKAVGGKANSWHLDFMAIDAEPDDPVELSELQYVCGRLGLEVVDEGDHFHIEPAGPRSSPPAG